MQGEGIQSLDDLYKKSEAYTGSLWGDDFSAAVRIDGNLAITIYAAMIHVDQEIFYESTLMSEMQVKLLMKAFS